MVFMGAPLLAYVQNIVQEVGVCVPGLLVMCGGNASVLGLLLRDCWRKAYIAVSCSAALHLGRKGRTFWIGTADLDRLFSYPQRHNLSSSWFPIHFVAARVRTQPCTG